MSSVTAYKLNIFKICSPLYGPVSYGLNCCDTNTHDANLYTSIFTNKEICILSNVPLPKVICTKADKPAHSHICSTKRPRIHVSIHIHYDTPFSPIQPHSRRQTPLSSLSHQEMDLWPSLTRPLQLDSLLHIRSGGVLLSGLASSVLIFPDTPGAECDLSFWS